MVFLERDVGSRKEASNTVKGEEQESPKYPAGSGTAYELRYIFYNLTGLHLQNTKAWIKLLRISRW